MRPARAALVWVALAVVLAVPIAAAIASPLHQWRDWVYIAAGFAGIVGLALMLMQPLLASGRLPGLSVYRGRRLHRWFGGALVAAVAVHIIGLWITSPPDVIDALLFRSPTPFSVWGVIAMWALIAAALLAVLRRRLRLKPRTWRIGHMFLVVTVVLGTVVHAYLIEGAMETGTKIALSALVVLATAKVVADLRVLRRRAMAR